MSAELTDADLPSHPDPHAWTWTDAEKRAILRWGEELLATRTFPAPVAPAGFKLVPIEPTEAMLDEGAYCIYEPTNRNDLERVWTRMLDAAPGAPGQEAAAVQAVGAAPVAYSLRWPSDSRLNVGTVFDTRLEAQDHVDRCGGGIEIVPLYAALPPSGAGEKTS